MTTPVGSALATSADPLPRMRLVVEELAADRYAGRQVGTPGGQAAAVWLANYLSGIGAAVELDSFATSGVRVVYENPSLMWGSHDEREVLAFRRDFCEHLASADHPLVHRGPLLLAGARTVPGGWMLDSSFSAERVAIYRAAGLAGVLVPRGTDDAGWMPKMIAGPAPVSLPVLAVREDIHERMASAVRAGSAWAAGSAPIRTVDAMGTNVYGTFRRATGGVDAVLLTAHFDGVGDDPDGTRYPAAADNASGVAVIIEAARQLHGTLPAAVGLSVALLDAEEVGAQGSAHHAPQVDKTTWVINVDGAAALAEATAVEAGGPAHQILAALDKAGRIAGVPLRAGAMPSDNRRYAATGLPAVGIGMGIPGYQTPAETADRVGLSTLDRALRLVVLAVEALTQPGLALTSGDR